MSPHRTSISENWFHASFDSLYPIVYAHRTVESARAESLFSIEKTQLTFEEVERLILSRAVCKPSSDVEARQLAEGEIDCFAAWYVEDRSENQILMCDFRDRTRSWLMVSPLPEEGGIQTRLYFGSAVVSTRNENSNKTSRGLAYGALLGFHKIYSRALLYSAKSLLKARNR